MKIIPETEMIVSSNDHVKNVSFNREAKVFSEHPETCIIDVDRITLPAPIASTTNATFVTE